MPEFITNPATKTADFVISEDEKKRRREMARRSSLGFMGRASEDISGAAGAVNNSFIQPTMKGLGEIPGQLSSAGSTLKQQVQEVPSLVSGAGATLKKQVVDPAKHQLMTGASYGDLNRMDAAVSTYESPQEKYTAIKGFGLDPQDEAEMMKKHGAAAPAQVQASSPAPAAGGYSGNLVSAGMKSAAPGAAPSAPLSMPQVAPAAVQATATQGLSDLDRRYAKAHEDTVQLQARGYSPEALQGVKPAAAAQAPVAQPVAAAPVVQTPPVTGMVAPSRPSGMVAPKSAELSSMDLMPRQAKPKVDVDAEIARLTAPYQGNTQAMPADVSQKLLELERQKVKSTPESREMAGTLEREAGAAKADKAVKQREDAQGLAAEAKAAGITPAEAQARRDRLASDKAAQEAQGKDFNEQVRRFDATLGLNRETMQAGIQAAKERAAAERAESDKERQSKEKQAAITAGGHVEAAKETAAGVAAKAAQDFVQHTQALAQAKTLKEAEMALEQVKISLSDQASQVRNAEGLAKVGIDGMHAINEINKNLQMDEGQKQKARGQILSFLQQLHNAQPARGDGVPSPAAVTPPSGTAQVLPAGTPNRTGTHRADGKGGWIPVSQ